MAHMLEADKPLSQSLLWEIQRRYFLAAGIDAWRDDVVPHSISCSPYMARAYGQVIRGYLRDLLTSAEIDTSQPLYIIELGAGSGRLTHHLLYQLEDLIDYPPYADLDLRFVLTDFVPDTITFWQNHPQLTAWANDDTLDFAHFDATDPQPLHLLHADITLTPDTAKNPIILLANYFFDSIPQDSFVVESGDVSQNLLTLYSSQPEPDLSDPTLWDRLTLAYEPLPVEHDYTQDVYDEILGIYAQNLPDTTVSFPNIGLDCIRWWRQFGGGDLLLLSADRGYTLFDALVDQPAPLPNLHGSFSMMVNYNAIGLYTELAGGTTLHAHHYQDNLQVGTYLFGKRPRYHVETQLAFEQAIVKSGPDDFFALRDLAVHSAETLTLPHILSILRFSAHDADLFRILQPRLLHLLDQASPAWHRDIASVLARVDLQHLPLGSADTLAPLLAPLHAKLV